MARPVRWDPAQYQKYGDERSRPFLELLARVDRARADAPDPASVVDLGCGPGPLTRLLADRWPTATVLGVDSSPDMVAAAHEYAVPGRLEFAVGDVTSWESGDPVDVLVANAVFQWVPDHVELLPQLGLSLRPGGVFAFQVPDNFGEPSHTLLHDLRVSPRWRDLVGAGAYRGASVERPERYLAVLAQAGLEADVWQASYLHVLTGPDPVLDWVKGTALRPVLSLLEGEDREEFIAEYAAALRTAYPPQEFGTVFPFRRTFAVARRPA